MNQKTRVLIVDDDADLRHALVEQLALHPEFQVQAVETAEAALQAVTVTTPDLVIMDLGMPAMTGDQATARLKADPSTRDIPVIVTTAFSYGPLLDRAISAGADEIMHKPLELKSLRLVVQQHLSLDYQPDGISNGHC